MASEGALRPACGRPGISRAGRVLIIAMAWQGPQLPQALHAWDASEESPRAAWS